MKLGEKIKTLRKERHMTQSALAGDRITRSMLCEIEKEKASPSLDTLSHLASELGVPAAFLLDESEDIAGYRKREAMPEIRALYASKKYADCFRLCEEVLTEADDELAFLLAYCALEEGKRAFKTGNLETALAYFGEATTYAEKTVYPTAEIRAAATLYAALSGNIAAPRRDFDEKAYRALCDTAVESDLYAYMSDTPSYPYRNEYYALHQKGRELLAGRRYREALTVFEELEARKGEPGISAYLLFRLYSDMETCYREERDFERAYKYATKRITLLSAFQS